MTVDVRELNQDWIATAEPAWEDLSQDSGADPVFNGYDWFRAWHDTLGATATLILLGFFDSKELVGLAPMTLAKNALGIRSLRFATEDDTHADHLDILARHGREADVGKAFARWLDLNRGRWDLLDLRACRADGVASGLASLRSYSIGTPQTCPTLKLGTQWTDFLKQSFSKKKRYNLERQLRMATDRHGFTFEQIGPQDSPDTALTDLFDLHLRRKRAQGIASALERPDIRRFHEELARRLHGKGRLILAFFSGPEGRECGAYCFTDGSVVRYFQTGLTETALRHGLGSALLTQLIKNAVESGAHEFDFLRGNEAYKLEWTNMHNNDTRIAGHARTLRGRLSQVSMETISACKSCVSTLLPARTGN